MRTAEATWTDLAGRAPLLVVPVGATEQHGPHLPLDTDTRVARALAARLHDALVAGGTDVVLADPLPVGSSGEHAGFAGTLSIGQDAVEVVLVELVRSASAWAAGTVLVNGHGGNAAPVERAVARLRAEGRPVLAWWPPAPAGGDLHAGRTETSLLLALDPPAVRTAVAETAAGDRRPLAALLPLLQRDGVVAVAPNGVLGDPAGASAEEGRALLAAFADHLVSTVRAWQASAGGPGTLGP